jgi:hypothetical protein
VCELAGDKWVPAFYDFKSKSWPGRTTGGHFWIKGGRNVVGRRARRDENITSVMSQGGEA